MTKSISSTILQRLLTSHAFALAGRYVSQLFLNIYIWRETEDITLVVVYNVIMLLVHCGTFHVMGNFVKQGHALFVRKAGLVGYAFLYFFVMLLGSNAISWIPLIAAIIGFFNALYWLGYHIFRFDLTTTTNRGNYSGWEHGLRVIAGLVMPALGGWIIAMNILGLGYPMLFMFGSLLFFTAFFVGNVNYPPHSTPKLHLRESNAILHSNKKMNITLWTYVMGGFGRGGAMITILLPFYVYLTVGSELEMGGLLSLFAVVAAIASALLGKRIPETHYRQSVILGTVLMVIPLVCLIVNPNYWTVLLFGIMSQISLPLVLVPRKVTADNLVHTLPDHTHHRVEYVIIREWWNIGVGRVGSYLLLLLAPGFSQEGMMLVLGLMIIALILEAVLFCFTVE